MSLNINQVAEQLENHFGFRNPTCTNLNTLVNDVIEVVTTDGHFALKLYNSASRTAAEVQWELDLTLHLIKNGAPIVSPIPIKNKYMQV